VRRAGSRIRVTAQLVKGDDGVHLWSERYDREIADVFAVQDEISQSIVSTLKLKLAGGTSLVARETSSVEAYHAYLKGRHHLLKVTPEEVARGLAYFDEAIDLDPTYAAAFASMARAFHVTAFFGWKPPREAMPMAKAAASKAVALNESDPDAQLVLSLVAGQYDYDWEEALRRCRLALACPAVPSDVRSLCGSFVLLTLERYDEALAAVEHARATDPLSPIPQHQFGGALAFRGEHVRAREELERLIELHPSFWPGYQFLGCQYLALEMLQEAIGTFERGVQLMPSYPALVGLLAGCYARTGDGARAERLLAPLAAGEGRLGTAMGLALFHLVLSDFTQAAHHYARGIDERDPSVPSLGPLMVNDRFRQCPEGRAILQRMNLAHLAR
jgi:serine/threonine-protein kinase